MNRRRLILAAFAMALPARPALAAPLRLEVYKSPTCGCCAAWMNHMSRAGFAVIGRDRDQDTLWSIKERAGITPELGSCHTAFIGGYVVEGHVPAGDIRRLLSGRPDAIGLAVPGMPAGSPGMEMGNQRDVYDTFLVLRNGTIERFRRHGL